MIRSDVSRDFADVRTPPSSPRPSPPQAGRSLRERRGRKSWCRLRPPLRPSGGRGTGGGGPFWASHREDLYRRRRRHRRLFRPGACGGRRGGGFADRARAASRRDAGGWRARARRRRGAAGRDSRDRRPGGARAAGCRHHHPEGALGARHLPAPAAAAGPGHHRGHGVERHPLVVLPQAGRSLRGPAHRRRRPRRHPVGPDRAGARHRLRHLRGRRDRRARRDRDLRPPQPEAPALRRAGREPQRAGRGR